MLKTLLVLCVCVASFAQSQTILSARVGVGIPFEIASTPSFSSPYYWEVGFHGDISIKYLIVDWAAIAFSIDHDWYPFNRYSQMTPSEYGGVLASSGSPAQLTRMGLSVEVATRSSGLRPKVFIEAGAGYALERYGRIDVIWGTVNGGVSLRNSYSQPRQDYWSVWTRAGVRFRLSDALAIEPAISLRFRLDDWQLARRSTYGCVLLDAEYSVSF